MNGSSRRSIVRRRAAGATAALTLLLAALTAPAVAAPAASGEPAGGPRFPIETITVEGARHASAGLIVSESLLTEGRSYTEAELRQAIYRIKRLPFLVDTRFALRKGSERGSYELVITVEETSPIFFGLDLDNGLAYSSLDGAIWFGQGEGTIGARWFTGRHGVLFGAVEGAEAQVGYTHYDLFGRRVFATLVYGRTSERYRGLFFDWDSEGPRFQGPADHHPDTERFTLLTGFPLTTHQTLRFSASSTEAELDEDTLLFEADRRSSGRRRTADVQWIYDSTDDPVLPTRGWLINLGVVARRESFRGQTLVFPEPLPVTGDFERRELAQELENVALVVGVRRYRPLSSRQTLWFAGAATLARTSIEQHFEGPGVDLERSGTTTSVEAGGGYAVSLWEPGSHGPLGDLRFEATYRLRQTDADLDRSFETGDGLSAVGGVGLVLRNRWGLFRFGFNVEDLSGSD